MIASFCHLTNFAFLFTSSERLWWWPDDTTLRFPSSLQPHNVLCSFLQSCWLPVSFTLEEITLNTRICFKQHMCSQISHLASAMMLGHIHCVFLFPLGVAITTAVACLWTLIHFLIEHTVTTIKVPFFQMQTISCLMC